MKNSKILLFFLIVFLCNQFIHTIFAQNSRNGTYKILKEKNEPVKIPFIMHRGKPLMEAKINGKKAHLMIDNGRLWNEVWLLGSNLVKDLNLQPVENSVIGDSNPTQAYTSSKLTLKFEEIEFYDQPSIVSPESAGFAQMFQGTDGQISNTFFAHFIVEFDFANNVILLHKPESFKYSKNGICLDMIKDSAGNYSIPFSFTLTDGKIYNDRANIDLGGIYTFKIALNNKLQIPLPANVTPIPAFGYSGNSGEYKGEIKNFKVGEYVFSNPIVVFGDEKTSRIHPENLGVIGLPFFLKFNTIFDYFNNKLYLTK